MSVAGPQVAPKSFEILYPLMIWARFWQYASNESATCPSGATAIVGSCSSVHPATVEISVSLSTPAASAPASPAPGGASAVPASPAGCSSVREDVEQPSPPV